MQDKNGRTIEPGMKVIIPKKFKFLADRGFVVGEIDNEVQVKVGTDFEEEEGLTYTFPPNVLTVLQGGIKTSQFRTAG